VLVEITATPQLDPAMIKKCMMYLRATDLRVALLLNFGRPRLEVKRCVYKFEAPRS
jgi:GxxExxY protein